jgi:hypothetical protein
VAATVEDLQRGQRVHVDTPGLPEFATVRFVTPPNSSGVAAVFLADDAGSVHEVRVGPGETAIIRPLVSDGTGESARVLAGMWTRWMAAAATNAESSAIASTQLRPYAHQTTAVYGAMLPQPLLRFLLADEPGTGKTIMAALYLREMQRLGLVRRAIVVCPANLASKWIADFKRFFGGGLRHLTANTIREDAVGSHDLWVVSLELAAVNPAVQEAIRPDLAGWDLVVLDEAHRLTPQGSRTSVRATSALSSGPGTLDTVVKSAALIASVAAFSVLCTSCGICASAAEPVRDGRGHFVPDAELRDTENIPLGDDVEDYLHREVRPHVSDASCPDPAGKVGYEIPFTRLFFRYTPPRPTAETRSELRELERDVRRLLERGSNLSILDGIDFPRMAKGTTRTRV